MESKVADEAEKIEEIDQVDLDYFLSDKIHEEIHRVDQYKVHDTCYRVNVWRKSQSKGGTVPSFSIIDSFYIEVTNGGRIIDRTIKGDGN